MTGGQAVVERLKDHQVRVVFGIISFHTVDLFDALYDVQNDLRHVGGRTELACGFMADGYARSTGRPGVVLTSTGPGAANSMHSMGEAYHCSSPVLQITTNVERQFLGQGRGLGHEPKEQLQMFRSVTDWNALVSSVESIPDHIDEAFARFQTRRPRPIELEIPTDLLGEVAEVATAPPTDIELSAAAQGEIESAVRELRNCRRPILWAGEEMNYSGGTEELQTLAETLGAPVVTAEGAKGMFNEEHPLSLGTVLGGGIWGENLLHEFIPTCDLVLALGTNFPYWYTAGAGLKLPERLVHVVLDESSLGKNYPATVGIAGNSRLVLQELLSALEDTDVDKGDSYKAEVHKLRGRNRQELSQQRPNEVRALAAVRSVLPRDTITCWDVTVAANHACRAFPVYDPRTFLQPFGWFGLGFSLPAALGAKAANPGVPVVCFAGDGGFQYCMSELATAAQYGLNITVVIFNDDAWGVLKWLQKTSFGERSIGTELVNPDFVKLAESYGFHAARVTTVKELLPVLEEAISSPEFSLIEVRTPQGFAELK